MSAIRPGSPTRYSSFSPWWTTFHVPMIVCVCNWARTFQIVPEVKTITIIWIIVNGCHRKHAQANMKLLFADWRTICLSTEFLFCGNWIFLWKNKAHWQKIANWLTFPKPEWWTSDKRLCAWRHLFSVCRMTNEWQWHLRGHLGTSGMIRFQRLVYVLAVPGSHFYLKCSAW